jgi:hypothetical protein
MPKSAELDDSDGAAVAAPHRSTANNGSRQNLDNAIAMGLESFPEDEEDPDFESDDVSTDDPEEELVPETDSKATKSQSSEQRDLLAENRALADRIAKLEQGRPIPVTIDEEVDIKAFLVEADEGWDGLNPTLKRQAEVNARHHLALLQANETLASQIALLHFKQDRPDSKGREAEMVEVLKAGFCNSGDYLADMNAALDFVLGKAASKQLAEMKRGREAEKNRNESGALRRDRPARADAEQAGRNGKKLMTLSEALSDAVKQTARKRAVKR